MTSVSTGILILRKWWLIAVVTVVSGCTNLSGTFSFQDDRLAKVESLVAHQEFAQAQELLIDIDTRDPQFERLVIRRRALRPLIEQFERNTVVTSERLQAQNLWPQALQAIDDALVKLPDSVLLQDARSDFLNARKQRLASLQRQLNLLKGQQLPAQMSLMEQIAELDPDSLNARWQYYFHNRRVENVADDLLACGREAMELNDLPLASDCLKTARQLSDSPDIGRLLIALDKQVRVRERKQVAKARRQAHKQKQHLATIKEEYQDLIAAGWWLAARDKMSELLVQAPSDDEVIRLYQDLQQLIAAQVKLGIKQGQLLYSQGYLRQALSVWQETSGLAPENAELQSHISRVERFLDKLSRLDSSEG